MKKYIYRIIIAFVIIVLLGFIIVPPIFVQVLLPKIFHGDHCYCWSNYYLRSYVEEYHSLPESWNDLLQSKEALERKDCDPVPENIQDTMEINFDLCKKMNKGLISQEEAEKIWFCRFKDWISRINSEKPHPTLLRYYELKKLEQQSEKDIIKESDVVE